MSSAARYPSTAPAAMPTADFHARSSSAPPTENSPCPPATASTAKVRIAPVASLKADSLITVWATRSRILIWRNTGTSVAGSVDAMVEASSSATSGDKPSIQCAARPVIAAVITTPSVASTVIVIHTSFNTLNRSEAPPSNRMYDAPNIRISWLSVESVRTSSQPAPAGPSSMPAMRRIATSGTRVLRATRPHARPATRMMPKTCRICLADSIDAGVSILLMQGLKR